MGSRWEIQLGDFVRSISDGLYGFIIGINHTYDVKGIKQTFDVNLFLDDGIFRAEIDSLAVVPVTNEERTVLRIMSS